MTKERKKRKDGEPTKAGAPTKYRAEFCGWLIDHFKRGKSYATFPATIYRNTKEKTLVGVSTLYDWENDFPEFSEAKTMALSLAQEWWEEVGNAMTTGSMRRVKSEKTVTDKNGKQVKTKEYEHTRGNSKVWSITMKNRFGYRERLKVEGAITNFNKNADDMTLEEINKELEELQRINQEDSHDK